MDLNSPRDLMRLEEQIFSYKPNIKSTEQKKKVSNRLKKQLLESKAVVKIQRMDAECESLMISLKQRLLLLQDVILPTTKNMSKDKNDLKIYRKGKVKTSEILQADTSSPPDSSLQLTLHRKPIERTLSYSSLTSTPHSKNNHLKSRNKRENTVTSTGVMLQTEEMLIEHEEVDTTPTLHIKIPSLHRGNVHYIILDSLNFARNVFDYRANEIKQHLQEQNYISENSKVSKSNKKQLKPLTAPVPDQFTQHEQELQLSQLIQDVMTEACVDETVQAANTLENINKNLIDNYDPLTNDTFITYSQSSQELLYSQNSNELIDTVCNDSESGNTRKKSHKNTKRRNEQKIKEPPKKRGRKPKNRTVSDSKELQPQPPTKSNLAKYVEYFSNDCQLLPGSSTPAASSTKSQYLVSSTTQNFEAIHQVPQQEEQEYLPQQPITYYIEGDWANGGLCNLVPRNNLSIDGRHLNQDDTNAPFQDFVNYIGNSGDTGSSVITRDKDSSNSLPISIPLTIANFGIQNKNCNQASSHQIHQPAVQNSLEPIINIQIPTLPNNIIGSSIPPPAHTHKQVLDLSLKSQSNINILSIDETFNINLKSKNNVDAFRFSKDDNCLPLDLSAKGDNAKEKISENKCVTIDNQDEEFICRLIEQSEFDYGAEEINKVGCAGNSTYDQDSNKSFKAALDMPLLDFDTMELAQLVENRTTANKKHERKSTDQSNCNDSTNNDDSNYVSMIVDNSSAEADLHNSDQSTTKMLNELLNICPAKEFLNDMGKEYVVNSDLHESIFDQCRMENSTMCDMEISTNSKILENQLEVGEKEICNVFSENNTTTDELESSTALAVNLNTLNTTTGILVDMSLNLNISDNHSNELQNAQTINLKKSTIIDTNSEMCSDTQQYSMDDKQYKVIATTINYENDRSSNKFEIGNSKGALECSKKSVMKNKSSLNVPIKDNDTPAIDTTSLRTNDNSINNNDNKLIVTGNTKNISNRTDICSNDTLLSRKTHSPTLCLNNSAFLQKFCCVKSKPKENIVFSVAKINLSDDENLYATDSDASSGKSCELGELKNNDVNANINKELPLTYNDIGQLSQSFNVDHTSSSHSLLNDSTVIEKELLFGKDNENFGAIAEQNIDDTTDMQIKSSCGDTYAKELIVYDKYYLNNCNNQVKKLENVENIVEQENIDISKNAEGAEVTNVKDGIEDSLNLKTLEVPNENLTLLELESKLDASLDFDEVFDDALSLATSCFDSSPVDARFEDSIDIDTTTSTNTVQDIQDVSLIYPQQIKEPPKHFKIPKISNLTDESSTVVENNPEGVKFSNSVQSNYVPQTAFKSVEKITRTIKNDMVQLNESTEVILAEKDFEDGRTILEKIAFNVFGISCLPYLVDKCYDLTQCQLSHELNDTDKVYQNLNTLDKIEANVAYQVMYNHSKLFKVYFEVFSIYYSTKNYRLKLLNMVNDCERYPENAEFFIVIYEALVKCGLSRVNACRLLLKRIREKSIATSIVETLVAIIMKSDWTMFTDFIEKYTQDIYKYNFRIGTLELMAPAVLNSKGPHLKQVFGKCVQMLHCDDMGLLLNSPSLIHCVALLTANTQ